MKKQFWVDPYLWVHGAGLAVVPLALLLCLWGLAGSDPVLPSALELMLVALVGIVPIGWMQLQRPFYIYSLPGLAIAPDRLAESQRRILTLFRTRRNPAVTGLASGILGLVLWQLYRVAAEVGEAAPGNRWLGLMVAALGFLLANLFLQVPLSVFGVMWATDAEVAKTMPYPIGQIKSDFSVYGISRPQILPDLQAD
jgi:hypothetical protein